MKNNLLRLGSNLLWIIIIVQASYGAAQDCPDQFELGNDSSGCYRFVEKSLSWIEARKECQSATTDNNWSDLVVLESTEEIGYILNRTEGFWWIGLSVQSDEWRWSDCTLLESDELANSTENCASLGAAGGGWQATNCSKTQNFICEITEKDKRPADFRGSALSTSDARLWWTPSVDYICDVAGYRIFYSDFQFPVYDTVEIFNPEISENFLERLTQSANYSVTIGIILNGFYMLPTTTHSNPIYIQTYSAKPDDLGGTPPAKVCNSGMNGIIPLKETSTLHLISPGYPNNYVDYENCLWTIRNRLGEAIKITYRDFDTEEGYDKVIIGIGPDPNNRDSWLDFSSGNIPFSTKVVDVDILWVQFTSDGSNSEDFGGFLLDFDSVSYENFDPNKEPALTTQATVTCGEPLILYPNSSVTIESPGFQSGSYENNLNCQWNISSSQDDYAIRIIVENFDTEYNYDVLTMGTGPTADISTAIKTLSGSLEMDPMVVEVNQMWMTFTSDHSVNKTGFSIILELINGSECGFEAGLSSDSPLTLVSPGYPLRYTNNLYCRWHITSDSNVVISPELFDTEASYDEMEIFTGSGAPSSNSNSRLHRISGELRESIFIDSSEIWLTFRTDGSTTSPGFSLQLRTANDIQCGNNEDLIDENGELTSVNFPNRYPNDMDCSWTSQYLLWPENSRVEITFSYFDVENYFDYVQIGEGRIFGNNILANLTGNALPNKIVVYRNDIWITFTSDHSVSGLGWSLKYQRITPENLVASNQSNSLVSPRYPLPYQPDSYTEWQITVDAERFVRLDFVEFETNSGSDWLRIGTGSLPTTESKMLILSGSKENPENNIGSYKIPDTYISSGNKVWITFESGFLQESRRIFNIKYTAVDKKELPSGETIYLTSSPGIISSPADENGQYYSNQVNTWVIELAYDNLVNLDFLTFETEEGYDILSVGSGTIPGLETLLTISGSVGTPNSVTSKSNAMWIQFVTDIGNSASGFRLRYSALENPIYECGGDLEASEEKTTIYSPNYPNNYPPFSDCVWTIRKKQTTSALVLDVTINGLERNNDFLLIGTGSKVDENIVYSISTNVPMNRVYTFDSSSGNDFWLHFTSNQDIESSGFEVIFYTTDQYATTTPIASPIMPTIKKESTTVDIGEDSRTQLQAWGIAIVALGVIIGVTIILGGIYICIMTKVHNKKKNIPSATEIELEAANSQQDHVARDENDYVEVYNVASSSSQKELPASPPSQNVPDEITQEDSMTTNQYAEIHKKSDLDSSSTHYEKLFPPPPPPLTSAADVPLVDSEKITEENTTKEDDKGNDNPAFEKEENSYL